MSIQSERMIEILSSHREPIASLTRPADTTAYAVGDVVGHETLNYVFTDVHPVGGSHVIISNLIFEIDVGAVPSGMGSFKLHLFDANPTVISDNSAFNIVEGDRSKYLGHIDIDTPTDLGDTLFSCMKNINYKTKLANNSTTLYGVLETRSAFTPSASTVKSIRLGILGV